jgi:DNA-directed RNA polymerase specialized sigma24 family protein
MNRQWDVRTIKIKGSPTKKPIQKLPWPRWAEDGTPIGIDVEAKRQDIVKLTYKYYRVPGVTMDELLQEVFLAILHKNHGNSAHDPRKSSFGHYVCMIANNVCINFANKRKRLDRERESIDTSDHDDKIFLESYEPPVDESDTFDVNMADVELKMREDGQWELARYLRMARSGFKPDVVREAMTWGSRRITTKYIRDLRDQISHIVPNYV